MAWAEWATQHWFDLIQTFGILGSFWYTAVAVSRKTKVERVATALELASQHRGLWIEIGTRPELARIKDAAADLAKQPLERQEALFTNLLIQHLASSHQAIMAGIYKEPAGLAADIRTFFALPIPKAVWEQQRTMLEPKFVEFVEKRRG